MFKACIINSTDIWLIIGWINESITFKHKWPATQARRVWLTVTWSCLKFHLLSFHIKYLKHSCRHLYFNYRNLLTINNYICIYNTYNLLVCFTSTFCWPGIQSGPAQLRYGYYHTGELDVVHITKFIV